MEEGDAEGEGPMAVREGPSCQGLTPNANSNTTTTNNLLASVKEQVGGLRGCRHTLLLLLLLLFVLVLVLCASRLLSDPLWLAHLIYSTV